MGQREGIERGASEYSPKGNWPHIEKSDASVLGDDARFSRPHEEEQACVL
jgi:hypothetical protein